MWIYELIIYLRIIMLNRMLWVKSKSWCSGVEKVMMKGYRACELG